VFTAYGRVAAVYEPIGRMVLVLTFFWLVCVWLYRSKLVIRI
jgi:hypothetical protein